MPYSIATRQGRQILTLEGAVTIGQAQDLAAKLREDVEDGVPIEVETQGLQDIDTCVVQLLCSLRKTVPSLSFDNPSEAFTGAVERCGLRRELLTERESL
jgi:hypothetical protein